MGTILSITPYKYSPPLNGGHQGIILVDTLLSIHNDVISLSTDDNVIMNNSTIKAVYKIPSSIKRYIPFSISSLITRELIANKATHLFIHHHYLFPSAYKAAKKCKIPLYIRSHNIEALRFKSLGKKWWRIMWWFEKYAYSKADKIFFVTKEDKNWAVNHYNLIADKCFVMPFGIQSTNPPQFSITLKENLANKLKLRCNVPWIFFMGKLDYEPNSNAVNDIIKSIYPELKKSNLEFELLIFGKGLTEASQEIIQQLNDNNNDIHYLGFVPSIDDLLTVCDIMLNPVNSGGGVKTKVIEAIAWNNVVISSHTGAEGIEKDICGDQLIIVDDKDWPAYANAVKEKVESSKFTTTPSAFYEYYTLNKIADRIQPEFDA